MTNPQKPTSAPNRYTRWTLGAHEQRGVVRRIGAREHPVDRFASERDRGRQVSRLDLGGRDRAHECDARPSRRRRKAAISIPRYVRTLKMLCMHAQNAAPLSSDPRILRDAACERRRETPAKGEAEQHLSLPFCACSLKDGDLGEENPLPGVPFPTGPFLPDEDIFMRHWSSIDRLCL